MEKDLIFATGLIILAAMSLIVGQYEIAYAVVGGILGYMMREKSLIEGK